MKWKTVNTATNNDKKIYGYNVQVDIKFLSFSRL